jgi:hypothetical protein
VVPSNGPALLDAEESLELVRGMPLRIRIRGDAGRCFVEWEALEALVTIGRSSSREIEIECVTRAGERVVLSLV